MSKLYGPKLQWFPGTWAVQKFRWYKYIHVLWIGNLRICYWWER